jgi:hypothetical protein
VTLKADFVNFRSLNEFEAFFKEVQSTSPIPFERGMIRRKAYISNPEIIITISEGILVYLASKGIIDKFVNKIADKLGDEVAEDIVDFYIWIKSVATKLIKYVVPKNRPITYIFSFPITPHVELIAQTSDADEIVASIMEDNLEKPLKAAAEFRARLGATRVQFLLDKKGEWNLNYLLTDKGQVIGTETSFSRKAHQVDLPLPTNMAITKSKQPARLRKGKHRKNRR